MSAFIVGMGGALPERHVSNEELGPILDVTPDWIYQNCGIRERRWVAASETASDLAARAVVNALADAGVDSSQLDYLIGCTLSPDYQVPGVAPIVQNKVAGTRNIPALDIRVGCAGILYSLQLAQGLIASGAASVVGCFGAEAQSKGLDLHHRSAEISMLFGDGSGAVIVARAPVPGGAALRIDDILIETDGAFVGDLTVRSPGSANGPHWIDAEQLAEGRQFGSMNGRTVILQAVRHLAESAVTITKRNGVKLDQIDLVVPHQANANLLRLVSQKLSLPHEKVVMNLGRLGNTSGASAFLALREAKEQGRLVDGNRVLLLAFAPGFTWGAALGTVVVGT